MEVTKKHELKTYNAKECCLFRKTKEQYGGLSNMASGFPININGINILSSEALYQACRFPHLPEVQRKIISERSPMSAKMVGKPFRNDSRPDWDDVRIKIMRWCLRVKIAQNFISFGQILESTYDRPIVEDSNKDDFWGAIRSKDDENIIIGVNALGRLLMELRQFYNNKRFSYDMFVVEPLNLEGFDLYGNQIKTIDVRKDFISDISIAIRYFESHKRDFNPVYDIYEEVSVNSKILSEPEAPEYKIKEKQSRNSKRPLVKSKIEHQATLPLDLQG